MDQLWGESSSRETATLQERAKLFDEGNYGMFIHWGLYSHLAGKWKDTTYYGIGEWIMHPAMAGIPIEEYKAVASEFNPVDFDARSIARLAKEAGMKYIIITSKHHDGFAMFDSDANSFNIVDATPFGRDPMKELSAACKEAGLGFGFYYSHYQDWTAPGGSGGPKTFPDGSPATFQDYFDQKCFPQVREICTQYGSVDFIWFDTPGNMKKELVIQLADSVRKWQPNAMLCSRIGHGMGDYASKGDMEVPLRNIPGLWETPDTNNDSWSYAWYDNNFKSPQEILRRLVSTVGRGGTYLLNVGPDGKGNIPVTGKKFLLRAGEWIKKYPRVIYDAGPSPWGRALPWGDVTTREDTLYLTIFEWPHDGKLYLPGLKNQILSARLHGNSQPAEIPFHKKEGWTLFDLPCPQPDHPASVLELRVKGEPEVQAVPGIYPNIPVELSVEFANVQNAEKKKISWMEKFGEWKHAMQVSNWGRKGQVTWDVLVPEPGYYYLDLRYKGVDRVVWRTTTGDKAMVQNQQAATKKYENYPMGILEFKTAGSHTITVSLVEGDPEKTSLEAILFRPVNQ